MAAAEFEEFRNSCGEYLVLLWYYTDLVSMTSFCYHNYMVLAVIFGYFVEVCVVLHVNILYRKFLLLLATTYLVSLMKYLVEEKGFQCLQTNRL